VERLLALSRTDNKTMICDECGTKEALDAAGLTEGSSVREAILQSTRQNPRPSSAYERTRAAVYATGNRWAIENFHATHD
jgi:zinc finger protein 775